MADLITDLTDEDIRTDWRRQTEVAETDDDATDPGDADATDDGDADGTDGDADGTDA